MKFNIKKKLNLSRIDKELWPYEDEVYEAIDADSLDEAQKEVDRYYAQREGYFKAISESRKAEVNKQATLPLTPVTLVPVATPAPPASPVASNPATPNQVPIAPNVNPASNPVETAPVDSGVSNQAPKEFN